MEDAMKKQLKFFILTVIGIAVTAIVVLGVLVWQGVILLNNPSSEQYPVRGVDVSSYQCEIDWDVLASQDIQFAFIKATEGSSYVDPYFSVNYQNAQATSLRIGAYHFFSYDSSGLSQAQNFISNVPAIGNMLPPVVDIEFYGDKEKNLPEVDTTQSELDELLSALETHYNIKPILYATEKSYRLYIAGRYDSYDIWIRNVITSPTLSDGRAWTFWQYTNRETLDGYKGKEKFIDMNVFYGSKEDFSHYATSSSY